MTTTNDRRLANAVDLAQLLGTETDPTELLGAIATSAASDTLVTPDGLVEATDTIDRLTARMFLDFLLSRKYASEHPNGVAVELAVDECIDLLTATRDTRQILGHVEDSMATTSVEFLCTLPNRDPGFQSIDPVDFEMQQITTRLLSLCRNASDELVLTSPFLEVDGMEWLLPGLEGALERGVDLTLVSRELRRGQPNHDAVRELFSIGRGQPGDLHVYDYYEPSEESQHPKFTLHSKLLIADRSTAYVGSANFTRYGFQENLEVGVVVEAAAVTSLTDLVAHLVAESAVEVDR